MKNITKLFGIAVVAAIGFSFIACGGTPAPAPAPEPAPQPVAQPVQQSTPQPTPERTTLILDGASNYTVTKGSTLADIAKQFYNNAFYYPVILSANKSVIQNADRIYPNTQLVIPDLQKNLNDLGARKVVKQLLMDSVPFENSRHRNSAADALQELSNSL
ncbi:MAG: LysM peptidoglycan-binding domain-containing protein [Treponema sp.]|nr:LysM peptidoglycan-binding domain-containing protein [Treponema sp.]